MIYFITWIIQKIYVSGYTTLAWIISVLLLMFHTSDFLKMFNLGNKKVSENFENNDEEEETLEFEDYNKEEDQILGLNVEDVTEEGELEEVDEEVDEGEVEEVDEEVVEEVDEEVVEGEVDEEE